MAEKDTLLSASETQQGFFPELSLSPSRSWLQRLAKRLVVSRLQGIELGRLELIEGGERLVFGKVNDSFPVTGRVAITDGAFWERLAWGGSIGAAEAFCDGLWSTSDLTAVVRIFARNQDAMAEVEGGTASLVAPIRRLIHRMRSNTKAGSIRNISAHYDTGNEFFSQFLDPTLTYSCAIYPDASSSLETAQEWKLDAICRKLELTADDRLIEIGTGWGGLAIHAAKNFGCEVVTTTISQQQFDYATKAIADAGLSDRITVLQEDYRNLPERFEGRFDKLVSIEMIEAVGHSFLPGYFEVLSKLLAPTGLALIQAILIPDQRYEGYRREVDFIQHYIFPGSLLPSMARIQKCTSEETDFRLVDHEDLTPHYARTLADWRQRFKANERAIEALGLSETERRKWEYYFSYCEGGFLERTVADVHLLYAKPDNRRQARATELA